MNKFQFGLVLALLATLLPGRASARLWETEAQIEQRYGRPLPTGLDQTNFYAFENFAIFIKFSNGVSDEESYWHLDSKSALSEPEIRGILEANSNGSQWRQENENTWSVDGLHGRAYADYFANLQPAELHLYTRDSVKRMFEPGPWSRTRTGKEQDLQGVLTVKQEATHTSLVVRTDKLIVEIPWAGERFPERPHLIAGQTYTVTLRDQHALDVADPIARVSDRDGKSFEGLSRESKSFLLQRIQRGDDVVFDRSVYEVHQVKMSVKMGDVLYGLRATPADEARCERNFPHSRDFIVGGCISSPDSPQQAPIFVCPECVGGCRRINL